MLLLSLVLAHLIADFYLQTDHMVKEKLKNIWKHTAHHFILNALVLSLFLPVDYGYKNMNKNLLMPLFLIVITHFLIDYFKIKLVDTLKATNEENIKRLCFFIIDQLLHLGVIIFTCQLFWGLEIKGLFVRLLIKNQVSLGVGSSILFCIIIVILATSVSGHMIKILLGSLPTQLLAFEGKYAFKNERKEVHFEERRVGNRGLTEEYNYTIFSKHDLSRGKLIGYIERLLVLILTFYSAYPAIGFIVAAKSIARFKQMDDRDWAEYFLLGTLSSMFLGITLGIVLREFLK
ncbi:DUF3307 domain-containing protein [Neobacillus sp. PS3-34]|uniref:DUF3307 domain-containing protein n=1 Tax=Neobacillus sp. PS3-34 TaxID=3070678 RepID=UPI0027E17586|nr:DUF3307 domain-containing protein [Neobacillus sp. PS3-34]WML48258.1 DUF3307 domain-containing protein [Neobacillus sp. PS3-34]